jgi:hypothetical protein
MPDDVAAAFDAVTAGVAERLLAVRAIAYSVADGIPEAGGLREYTAWGEPALRPVNNKIGSSIRLGVQRDGVPAMFVHCGTPLVSEFRAAASHLSYEGKRAVLLAEDVPFPEADLERLIELAFTLHLRR